MEIGTDPLGNLQRLSNALEGMTAKMEAVAQKLENVEHQLETAKVEVTKPFAQEAELAEKLERLTELNALLNMDEKGSDGIDMDDEPETDSGEQQEIDTEEMQDDVGLWQTNHASRHLTGQYQKRLRSMERREC